MLVRHEFLCTIYFVVYLFGWLVGMQEIWDSSRKIQCVYPEKMTKYVTWSPIVVDMLDVITGKPSQASPIDCWMDILQGIYPMVSHL